MSRFAFNLATPADDGQLRQLLAATPMDGAVSIAFAREPSYFDAAAVDGKDVQVGVARDGSTGRIIGMGSRSISLRYVNGQRIAVGYLSGLRLHGEFRGRAGLLARGYRFLHQLHEDHRAPYYLTTIAADNGAATTLLTSGRAGLPVYHSLGSYHTLALSITRPSHNGAPHDGTVTLRAAEVTDRDAILTFLSEHGSSRQFFPAFDAHDLFGGGGLLKDLQPADILLALRDNQIAGTLACWNQRGFKQITIHGYGGWLRRARPVYNTWAKLRGRPTLPAAGSVLPIILAAIPVVRNNDLDTFRQLLVTMLGHLRARGERLLLVGLHDKDPLLPVARQFPGREYLTRLYVVYWPPQVPDFGQLKLRVPYLELGSL